MTAELHDIRPTLSSLPPLQHIVQMTSDGGFFLVGGALRDALLGHPVNDIDIASTADPTPVARQFASDHNAPWFWLNKERAQSRVLIGGDNPLTFDFAPLRAVDMLKDLAARDYTVNSLALSLSGPFRNDQIIDPLHGIEDLQSSCLRMSSTQSFVADPLRILKGIRHAVTLGFVLEEGTSTSMKHNAWRLMDVARERIRQEVWTILAHPAAIHGFELLTALGIGRSFWGACFDDHFAGVRIDFERCRSLWNSLRRSHAVVDRWLHEDIEAGLNREVLLLWVMLLSRVDRELTVSCAEEWLFSRRAQARIGALADLDRQRLRELDMVPRRPRSLGFWLQKHGLDAADMILMAVGLILPGEEVDPVTSWIPIVEELREIELGDLVPGDWLTTELGIQPGPDVGRALRCLRDAEIQGLVTNDTEARAYLREYHQNRD